MTPEQWRTVEEAFLAALELTGEARRAYVDSLDVAIRGEVERMVEGHEEGDRLLPVLEPSTVIPSGGAPPAPGMRAGPYRLIERIGEGGMGLVYRAERDDDEFRKQVAVKLIRAQVYGHSNEMLTRFRLEKQALALLDHPNIVRLLDAGVTPEGTPYFVMELVDGTPITRFAEEHQLDLAARLRVMEDVCSAIDSAHRHLIIHRDIKPANILVTHEGMAKVLDFGIAKLLDPLPDQDPGPITTFASPMTPDYASPEHLQRRPVTTASDIYSLGLVLYELVSGVKARPGPAQPIHTDRDLQSIFLKATAEDPAERYASAADLAADLRLYVAGLPVSARDATLRYVFVKAVLRNRGKVAAAAAGVLLATGALWWQSHQVALERQKRYEQVRDLARTMIVDMQDRLRNTPGSLETRRKLMAQALGYLESLRKESSVDPRFETELGLSYLQMATIQSSTNESNLGDAKGASESLEQARKLAESALANNPGFVPAARLLASYWERLSQLNHDPDGARRAFDIRRQLAERNPEDFACQREYATAFQFVAITEKDVAQSLVLLEQGAAKTDALLKRWPNHPILLRDAAIAQKYIGGRLDVQKRLPEAVPHFRRALELDQALLALKPQDRLARLDISFDWCSLGWAEKRNHQMEEAGKSLSQCVAIRQQLTDEEPKDVRSRDRLAYARMLFASYLLDEGQTQKALEESDRVIQIVAEEVRDVPSMARESLEQLTYAYRVRGVASQTLGRHAQACEAFRKAVDGFDRLEKARPGRVIPEAPPAREALRHCS